MDLAGCIYLFYILPQIVMAPKKKPDPDISHSEVENEIAELAGEHTQNVAMVQQDWTPLRSMMSDFFKEQDLRQNQLLSSLSQAMIQNNQAMLTAMQSVSKSPQQNRPTQQYPLTPKVTVLGSPPPSGDEVERDWDEIEDVSSDEDLEFEGFSFPPPSGRSSSQIDPKSLTQPSTSAQPQPTPQQQAVNPSFDEDLFNAYGAQANWQLASELIAWIQTICNQEIPPEVLKDLDEEFVPKEELQPIFVAPSLPPAINKRLFTAPKTQTRVPRIINSNLLRAQKELCISYKPLIEVLNFFYSEPFQFLIETIPELRQDLTRLKHLLSQGLAVLMSAALKISKARKHAIRPLLNYYATSILDSQPTSAHVLGSDDLASISDKASKERKAMSGVFRTSAYNRARYRPNSRFRSFRGARQPRYSQVQDSNRRGYYRSRPKNRPRTRPSKTTDK